MTNSNLFFRSLAVIVLLAGFAHLFAYTIRGNPSEVVPEKANKDITVIGADSIYGNAKEKGTTDIMGTQNEKTAVYNSEMDYIIGKWKVTYHDAGFKGSIIYNLKKEGNTFNAYTFQYEDENGYAQKAEGTMALSITEFDGYNGKGTYTLEYEGKKYNVCCQIDMVDENTFKLGYDYYGYQGIETWKRF